MLTPLAPGHPLARSGLRNLAAACAALLALMATTGLGVQLGRTLERGDMAAAIGRSGSPAELPGTRAGTAPSVTTAGSSSQHVDGIASAEPKGWTVRGAYGDGPTPRGYYPAAGLLTPPMGTSHSAYGDGPSPRGHYPAAGLLTPPVEAGDIEP